MMSLQGEDMIWVIVGAVAGGLFVLILFCLIIFKICRPENNTNKKRKRMKEKSGKSYANANYPSGSPSDHPLPAGIWTTNPGVYAATPSEVYAYTSGKAPLPSRQYKSGLVEMTFSEASLTRDGKYHTHPASSQLQKDQAVKRRPEKEVKQLHMTIEDDFATVHSGSKHKTGRKEEVVARAYSDYPANRRPYSIEGSAVTAFDNYSPHNDDPHQHLQSKSRNGITYGDSLVPSSNPELLKRAQAPHYRQMAPVKRVQSHIEKGQRYHVGSKQLAPLPSQNSRDHIIYRGSSNSGHRIDNLKRPRGPPGQSVPKKSQSLDRRPHQDSNKHQPQYHHNNKQRQFISNKHDPVRNNFVLAEKGRTDKSVDIHHQIPSTRNSTYDKDVDHSTPRINSATYNDVYFSSEPILSKPNRGEVPYTVPYDSIDQSYVGSSVLTKSGEEGVDVNNLMVSNQNSFSHENGEIKTIQQQKRLVVGSSNIEHKASKDDPDALYALPDKRRDLSSHGNNIKSVTGEADRATAADSVLPSPSNVSRHIDSDGEGLSTKGETITDSAFAFLAIYDDVRSVDQEDGNLSR